VAKIFDPPLRQVWCEDIASEGLDKYDAAECAAERRLAQVCRVAYRMGRPNGGHPSAERAKPTIVTVD
jgi:hypothetical protein